MKVAKPHVIRNAVMGGEYNLWCLGDIHWGAAGCFEEMVDRTIERIRKDRRALWIGMGDYFDLIGWQDKRFDPEMIAEKHKGAYFRKLGSAMVRHGAAKLKPIRNKCLGVLTGNHEWRYARDYDQAVTSDLAAALGVPFLGYSCWLDLVFKPKAGGRSRKRQRFRIVAHHGAGWARTPGGKFNRLRRFAQQFDCDIAIMGHVHMKLDDESVVLTLDPRGRRISQRTRLGVISGTYLRTYHQDNDGSSGYGERALYEPVPLGSPCIIISPETRELAVRK